MTMTTMPTTERLSTIEVCEAIGVPYSSLNRWLTHYDFEPHGIHEVPGSGHNRQIPASALPVLRDIAYLRAAGLELEAIMRRSPAQRAELALAIRTIDQGSPA